MALLHSINYLNGPCLRTPGVEGVVCMLQSGPLVSAAGRVTVATTAEGTDYRPLRAVEGSGALQWKPSGFSARSVVNQEKPTELATCFNAAYRPTVEWQFTMPDAHKPRQSLCAYTDFKRLWYIMSRARGRHICSSGHHSHGSGAHCSRETFGFSLPGARGKAQTTL